MRWFMPAHKSDVWCVWLHRIYGDGRVELLIWLAVPILDLFELSPLWRSVLVLLLLLLSLLFRFLREGVHVQSGLRDFGTLIYILSSYLLLRLMVPRRVPRSISPWATLRRAYRLSIMLAWSYDKTTCAFGRRVLWGARDASDFEQPPCPSWADPAIFTDPETNIEGQVRWWPVTRANSFRKTNDVVHVIWPDPNRSDPMSQCYKA